MSESKAQLKFYNTITKKKEIFTPRKQNTIDWYICGPTVYDSPHIGHARTYISFDVIRRVLEDYFGYNVNYVMNITDVDDKIINKAREEIKKNDIKNNFKKEFKDVCKEVTIKYENEFFDDLKALNVLAPNYVTRVTEYIIEIEMFIKNLIQKKMAYQHDNSIYFDIENYRKKFKYPIFVDQSAIKDEDEPNDIIEKDNEKVKYDIEKDKDNFNNIKNNFNNIKNDFVFKKDDIDNENEKNIELEKLKISIKKKNIADFVLWKERSEDLFYDCSIGNGRPGWHIECSAMANNIFPDGLDIHSGGIDLAFPHHENEIAQSQALIDKKWVNYFLHTGHLHIEGLKMSKSLKNFITIKEFLKEYTSRQIRISFLMSKWWMPMTFSKESMEYFVSLENKLFTFISVLQSYVTKETYVNNICMNEKDQKNLFDFENLKNDIHVAFCDNVDTSLALKIIFNYISKIYPELEKINVALKRNILKYFEKIIKILGLNNANEENKDKNIDEGLEILNEFRNKVRDLAKKKGDHKDFFKACDDIRESLKVIGYVIEDKGNESRIRKI